MSDNFRLDQRSIEKNYNLKFNNKQNETLFFEMFEVLLESRLTIIPRRYRNISRQRVSLKYYRNNRFLARRQPTEFDIQICMAALCAINWPGKTPQYRNEIENLKKLYFENQFARGLILNAFQQNLNPNFRNINNTEIQYFRSLSDLLNIQRL